VRVHGTSNVRRRRSRDENAYLGDALAEKVCSTVAEEWGSGLYGTLACCATHLRLPRLRNGAYKF
jgi:hypothetical protein